MIQTWLVKVQNGSDPDWSGVIKVHSRLLTLTFYITLVMIGQGSERSIGDLDRDLFY
jgi:hypothetical protein